MPAEPATCPLQPSEMLLHAGSGRQQMALQGNGPHLHSFQSVVEPLRSAQAKLLPLKNDDRGSIKVKFQQVEENLMARTSSGTVGNFTASQRLLRKLWNLHCVVAHLCQVAEGLQSIPPCPTHGAANLHASP